MKKFVLVAVIAAASLVSFGSAALAAPKSSCATIADGTILDSAGNPVVQGFDQFGYNYQARRFNGTYDSVDRVLDGTYWGSTGDFVDDKLMMTWSQDWLANVDCNGDNKLDRGAGATGTSQGWLTNHEVGDYTDLDGNVHHFTYFTKMVWVGPGGSLWGQYETIQANSNEPGAMDHSHAASPGFGLNDHWTTIP